MGGLFYLSSTLSVFLISLISFRDIPHINDNRSPTPIHYLSFTVRTITRLSLPLESQNPEAPLGSHFLDFWSWSHGLFTKGVRWGGLRRGRWPHWDVPLPCLPESRWGLPWWSCRSKRGLLRYSVWCLTGGKSPQDSLFLLLILKSTYFWLLSIPTF